MKKTYSTPVIDVKKFNVEDVITTSATYTKSVTLDSTNTASGATVEIVAKW